MSNPIPPTPAGATIFFTLALQARGSDLLIRHIDHLRDAIRRTCAERPFAIDAVVVLPDHLHAILTLPPGDRDFATRWRLIKARFSTAAARPIPPPTQAATGETGIWQRRLWEHPIRDAAELEAHRRHCWLNPVRHGLVDRAEDWLFSSIHRDRREGRVPHTLEHHPMIHAGEV